MPIPTGFFGGSGFGPVLHQYSTPGSSTESIPVGCSQVVIEVWGPGGGGSAGDKTGPDDGDGGSSGGYAIKTQALSPATWGSVFTYTVGVTGAGGSGASGGGQSGTSATDSTVAKSNFVISVNIFNTHGVKGIQFSGSTGITPVGGDTNTQGNSVSPGSQSGGAAIVGIHGTAGKGGDGGLATTSNNGPGFPGQSGLVSFYYT